MNVYTLTGFMGHWPVGTAAVVVAPSAERAAAVLQLKLENMGLSQKIEPHDFKVLETAISHAIVLCDGDY